MGECLKKNKNQLITLIIISIVICIIININYTDKPVAASINTNINIADIKEKYLQHQKQDLLVSQQETPVGILEANPEKISTLRDVFDNAYVDYCGKKYTFSDIMKDNGYVYANNSDKNYDIDNNTNTANIYWTSTNGKGYMTRLRLIIYKNYMDVWLLPPNDENGNMCMGDNYKKLFFSKYFQDPLKILKSR